MEKVVTCKHEGKMTGLSTSAENWFFSEPTHYTTGSLQSHNVY